MADVAPEEQAAEQPARNERFAVQGAVEIEVAIGVGRVAVHLDEHAQGATEATVEVRHQPSAQGRWPADMNAMLGWVDEQFGERLGELLGTNWRGSPADAVAQTRIEQAGGRLIVQSPQAMPARAVALAVTVHAPAGSAPTIKTSTADVAVTGQSGRVDISTGSGDVTLADTHGTCRVRTGSGTVRLGTVHDDLSARTGSGAVEVAGVSGSASAVTGTGAVWFGEASGDVFARTGSGNIAVADARSGSVELNTGSGDLRIGIGNGVTGEIEISSDTGRVVSELDVEAEAPAEQSPLTVHARTGTGNAVVRKSGL